MPSRISSFLSLLCIMALLPSAFGFCSSCSRPANAAAFVTSSSRLHQSSVPIEQEELQPSLHELPKSVVSSVLSKRQGCFQALEDISGRVAMVGAVTLLMGEVVTGESVVEQVADALHSLVV